MVQKYCTSCGQAIPDGQGKSCSMCYGDPFYGKDGYYLNWLEESERQHMEEQDAKQAETEMIENEIQKEQE